MKISDVDWLNAARKARETLHRAEVDTLERVALNNKPEDRKEYHEIRDMLEALDSASDKRRSFIRKLLKRLRLLS
jgi:hypothetical protein